MNESTSLDKLKELQAKQAAPADDSSSDSPVPTEAEAATLSDLSDSLAIKEPEGSEDEEPFQDPNSSMQGNAGNVLAAAEAKKIAETPIAADEPVAGDALNKGDCIKMGTSIFRVGQVPKTVEGKGDKDDNHVPGSANLVSGSSISRYVTIWSYNRYIVVVKPAQVQKSGTTTGMTTTANNMNRTGESGLGEDTLGTIAAAQAKNLASNLHKKDEAGAMTNQAGDEINPTA